MKNLRSFLLTLYCALAAGQAAADVTYRSAASAGVTNSVPPSNISAPVNGAATSLANSPRVPVLPSHIAGDLLICLVEGRNNSAITTASAGWVREYLLGGTNNHSAALFWKIAASGSEANPSFSGGNNMVARCSRFRGVDQSNPFDVPYAAALTANDDLVTSGTLTPVTSGTMVLFAAHFNVTTDFDIEPAGWTSTADYYTTTGLALYNRIWPTSPVTPVPTIDLDTNARSHGVLIALRPAVPTPPPDPLVINKPAGTLQGDVMLASVAVTADTPPDVASIGINAPAGWTLINAVHQDGGDGSNGNRHSRLATYYRVAGASEPANYTWSFSSTHTGAVGGIASFIGVDVNNPIDAQAGTATASGAGHIAPAVTTTVPGGMLVTTHEYASSRTWSPASGMTEVVEITSSGSTNNAAGISMLMAYEARPTEGDTGSNTGTAASGQNDRGATQSVALKPTLPSPIAHWKFEEAGWNGTANEVKDDSGNNHHGTAAPSNTPPTTTTLPTPARGCRSGLFDGTQSQYVNVPDSAQLRLANSSFTISVWIRPSVIPTSNGELMTIASKDENYEFHVATGGRINWWYQNGSNTVDLFTPNNVIQTNVWTHVALVYRPNDQRIYINGTPYSFTSAVTPPTNNADPFQFGGDQGLAGRFFRGLIDDLRIYNQALNTVQINELISLSSPCPIVLPDHYAISHNETAVNCEATPVTITAKNSSNNAVSANGTTITVTADRVSGTPNADRGDWQIISGGGTIDNGTADDGVAEYTFAANGTTVVLGLKNTHVQVVNINVEDDDGITEHSGTGNTEDPYDENLSFVRSAFRISDNNGNSADIPTQSAGVTSGTHYLQAIRTDDDTGACVNAFPDNTSVSIELAFECNNPVACQSGQLVSITNNSNASTIEDNPDSDVEDYSAKTMLFGPNARAAFTLKYPDVGRITLHARYALANAEPPSNFIRGSSNAFVVKPYNFVLSNIERTSGGADNPGTVSPDAASPVFIRAGEAFSATVTSVNADGNATPNYGQEIDPEGARLVSTLVEPTLANNPAVGNLTAFGNFNNGIATGTTFYWGEVGFITLQAGVGDQDYLGVGSVLGIANTSLGTASANVGRFQPHDFNVSYNSPQFKTFCGSSPDAFTYVGQNFDYVTNAQPVLTVTARNVQGGTTQNYGKTGGWFKLSNSSLTDKIYSAGGGNSIDTGLVPPTDPVINNKGDGTAELTFSAGGGIRFDRASTVPPFDAEISLSIYVLDGDNPQVSYGSNPARFGQTSAGNGMAFDQGKTMRFGRLRIFNALGSEQIALPILMRLEYWNGSGFALNTQDNCTQIPRPTLAMDNHQGLGTCVTAFSSAMVTFSGGQANPALSAPNQSGTVDIRALLGAVPSGDFDEYCSGGSATGADPGALTHLRGKWNDATNGAGYDDDPTARAAFGRYGSGTSRRFIYSRENY